MNPILFTAALVVTLFITSAPAHAQGGSVARAGSPQASVATPPSAALAEGEVRALDRAAGTVVIKHGPLKTLNMGPMTMEFVAKDPALLAKVKVGDKVRFTPAEGKDGTLLVTTLVVVAN